MDHYPEIRRRSNYPLAPNYQMEKIRPLGVIPGIPNLRIPDAILGYADPSHVRVRAYRDSLGLGVVRTDRPEPAGPTQRAQLGRRGGPRTMFRGSRGSRGSSGRGPVLRVAVRGVNTGRLMGAFPFPHHRPHDAGPSRRSRTPTPPRRSTSQPLASSSHTPSPIHRSSPVGSTGAGSVRSNTESDIPSTASQGLADAEASTSIRRSESQHTQEAAESEHS